MPPLRPCGECGCHVRADASDCPHCGEATSPVGRLAGAVLMGLAVAACNVVAPQPKYGALDTGPEWSDDDGDGFSENDGDCDDDDEDIHPEATETPGDGVDSNCNGEDDD